MVELDPYVVAPLLVPISIFRGSKMVLLTIYLPGGRYLGDSGSDRREILYDGTYRSQTGLLPFWGRYPQWSV